MTKITDIKFNINLKTILIIGVVLLLLIGVGLKLYQYKVNKLKDKVDTEQKLKDALLDKVTFYQNKEKEWTAEKLTIQETVKNLSSMKDELTNSQLELLNRVKEIQKNNSIISAALIDTKIKLDSFIHKGSTNVDVKNKNIVFSDTTKDLQYKIKISHVLPAFKDTLPTLFFEKFQMPNKQFIEFHWKNEKKSGYPVSFSVSNSNNYFKVVNIDSYAIPGLKKSDIDPNFWQKIGKFFNKTSGKLVTIGIAGGAGAAVGYFLLK